MSVARGAGEDLLVFGALAVGAYFLIKTVLPKFDPTSAGNAINQGANRLVQILTGDPNTTLGSKVYDAGVAIGMTPDWGAIAAADTVADPTTGRVRYLRAGTNSVIAESTSSIFMGSPVTTFYYPGTDTLLPGQQMQM